MRPVRTFEALGILPAFCLAAPAFAQSIDTLIEQGAAARDAGDFENAIALLERARQMAPDNVEILRLLGTSYAFDKQFPRAIAVLKQAHALAPDDADVTAALARAHMWSGQLEPARERALEMQAKQAASADAATILEQIAAARKASRGASGLYFSQSAADVALSFGHRTWWETTLGGYTPLGARSTLSADVTRADREFAIDTTMAVRLDHRVSSQASFYVTATATPDAVFKETWSLRAGGQWNLTPDIALLLDARHAHYNAVDTQSLSPALQLSQGAVRATVRMANQWNSDGFYGNGWSLRFDADLKGGSTLYAGGATAPDTEAGITRQVRSVFAGGTFPLSSHVRLRAGGEYERRTATYTRKGISAGLDWRF